MKPTTEAPASDDASRPTSDQASPTAGGEYEVGYGRPPKHTRFKKGVCPNPRGRGRRPPRAPADTVLAVLNETTEYRQNGRKKRASREEMAIDRHIAAALKGDVEAAALLLKNSAACREARERRTADRHGRQLPVPSVRPLGGGGPDRDFE